jgi:ATP-dependent RNA helicase DeaD
MEEFRKLGLSSDVLATLKKKGYQHPTPIQIQTIPLLLAGKEDIIAQSQTGTGKTASFALPIIEKCKEKSKHIQAIILTPTRELALQVAKEIESLMGKKRLRVLAVYGGTSVRDQSIKLRKGIDIVVGTPGRVIDQINRRNLNLTKVNFAVLDEADEMLNMGFLEDITKILKTTNEHKRMLLFSATIPKQILGLAKRFMRSHTLIKATGSQLITDLTDHIYYEVMPRDRVDALERIIDIYDSFYGIIFCRTKNDVDVLTRKLSDANYSVASLHGDISQAQREKILQLFRKRKITILVATDVAARGIDVQDITHVVNFSLPQNSESYVHRMGRTGRAGKKGIALTFISPSERSRLRFIERRVNHQLERKELPSPENIMQFQEKKVKENITKIIEHSSKKYTAIAKELLIKNAPVPVVASLLESLFKSTLTKNYKDISKAKDSRKRQRSGHRRKDFNQERYAPRNKRGKKSRAFKSKKEKYWDSDKIQKYKKPKSFAKKSRK